MTMTVIEVRTFLAGMPDHFLMDIQYLEQGNGEVIISCAIEPRHADEVTCPECEHDFYVAPKIKHMPRPYAPPLTPQQEVHAQAKLDELNEATRALRGHLQEIGRLTHDLKNAWQTP